MNNKTIKVLIFSGFGLDPMTLKMKEIMDKSDGIRRRVGEIVEYIENNSTPWEEFDGIEDVREKSEKNRELIVSAAEVKFDNVSCKEYYIWDENYKSLSSFSIMEVDSSRPWTIDVYDGSESIVYLDEKKIIDEELNYWK